MTVVTLLTDFGVKDPFVGMMKGVILSLAPNARLVDLTHEVPPQSILTGAFHLKVSYPFFPAHTIHVAVVDPGVGTERRAIAVQSGEFIFLAPDNGLLSYVLEREPEVQCYTLDRSQFHLPRVGRTFHGRDVFAPIAGHLAAGRSLDQIGTPIDSMTALDLPRPVPTESGWIAHILCADHFGNLITDLDFDLSHPVSLRCHGEVIPLGLAYQDVPVGHPIALYGSAGHLEIAVNGGSAKDRFGATVGEEICVVRK